MNLSNFITEKPLEQPLFAPLINSFMKKRNAATSPLGKLGWRSAFLVATLTVIPAYLLVEATVRVALLLLSSPLLVTTAHRKHSRDIGKTASYCLLFVLGMPILGIIQLGMQKTGD
jgi:hypothetical protein